MGPPLRIIYDAQRHCKACSGAAGLAGFKCLDIKQIQVLRSTSRLLSDLLLTLSLALARRFRSDHALRFVTGQRLHKYLKFPLNAYRSAFRGCLQ